MQGGGAMLKRNSTFFWDSFTSLKEEGERGNPGKLAFFSNPLICIISEYRMYWPFRIYPFQRQSKMCKSNVERYGFSFKDVTDDTYADKLPNNT